jgi:hypothetical protein
MNALTQNAPSNSTETYLARRTHAVIARYLTAKDNGDVICDSVVLGHGEGHICRQYAAKRKTGGELHPFRVETSQIHLLGDTMQRKAYLSPKL